MIVVVFRLNWSDKDLPVGTMSNDLTGEQMQAKITAARREAEGLKDRIKRKKDDLADTSCKSMGVLTVSSVRIC